MLIHGPRFQNPLRALPRGLGSWLLNLGTGVLFPEPVGLTKGPGSLAQRPGGLAQGPDEVLEAWLGGGAEVESDIPTDLRADA